MVWGKSDESHIWSCDSGTKEGGTHLKDGLEAESIELFIYSTGFFFF